MKHSITLTNNQATALYFALNSALIELDKKLKTGDKNRNHQSIEFERDLLKQIQLMLPDSIIKI